MALLLVSGALGLGIILGWYLRMKERWCRDCGGQLTCAECRPAGRPPETSARVRWQWWTGTR